MRNKIVVLLIHENPLGWSGGALAGELNATYIDRSLVMSKEKCFFFGGKETMVLDGVPWDNATWHAVASWAHDFGAQIYMFVTPHAKYPKWLKEAENATSTVTFYVGNDVEVQQITHKLESIAVGTSKEPLEQRHGLKWLILAILGRV